MNQKSRRKETSPVKRDFFKLLNNSNFGIDGRNNLGNCTLEPLYDEICEISCIKNYVPFLVTKLTGIFILES